jgi:hypothetical protein
MRIPIALLTLVGLTGCGPATAGQNKVLTGTVTGAFFCAPTSLSVTTGATGNEHLENIVQDQNNFRQLTWRIRSTGTGTDMIVECEACADFAGIAKCGGQIASPIHSSTNGSVDTVSPLEGSHIWLPGDFAVNTGGQNNIGGISTIDLNGFVPPIQGFGVASGTGSSVAGYAMGVQFLNGSNQPVSPQLDVTLFVFTSDSSGLLDLGRDDAGMCWVGNDDMVGAPSGASTKITVDNGNPPHKWFDTRGASPHGGLTAYCLAYSF